MPIELSPLLAAFVAAHNAHDSGALTACFADDAVVSDEGHVHRGAAAIHIWFEDVGRKYRPVLDVREVSTRGAHTVLTGDVSGNFDGSPIQLRYRFSVTDGKVAALDIAP